MSTIEEVYDRHHCWYLDCRKRARIRLTGMGCHGTYFCLPHFFMEVKEWLGVKA